MQRTASCLALSLVIASALAADVPRALPVERFGSDQGLADYSSSRTIGLPSYDVLTFCTSSSGGGSAMRRSLGAAGRIEGDLVGPVRQVGG